MGSRWPILLLLLAITASCATTSQDSFAQETSGSQVLPTSMPAGTITTEWPEDSVEYGTLPSGSVGDPNNPIGRLEDGSTFDPAWKAVVTLTCGPDPEHRTIAVFDADTNNRGNPMLYQMEPSAGGFALELTPVDSVVAPDVNLAWGIDGIMLGPWTVDTIVDVCEDE